MLQDGPSTAALPCGCFTQDMVVFYLFVFFLMHHTVMATDYLVCETCLRYKLKMVAVAASESGPQPSGCLQGQVADKVLDQLPLAVPVLHGRESSPAD